jgi:hypothetical protein
MARLFSVDFNFKDESYTALVNSYMKDKEISFDIKLYDPALYNIFPEGKLSYKGRKGYETLGDFNYPHSRELIEAIAGAIDRRLAKIVSEY